MVADASLYNQLGRYKSVQDYDNEARAAELNALQLASAKSQYDQGQEGIRRDNALRSVSLTGDDTADFNALRRIDPKAAYAHQKSMLDATKTRGEIGKNTAETDYKKAQTTGEAQKQKIAAHEIHLQQLGTLSDPSQIDAWAAQGVKDGVLDMQASMRGAQMMKEFAAQHGFEAAKAQAMRGGQKVTDQLKQALDQQKFGLQNANEIMTGDGKGGFTLNTPLVEAKKHVAKAGASNVSVKVDNALGEGVAKQVGPMLETSYNNANGAQSSIANADNIINAIDSGKVIAGPAANLRLAGAQLAQTLGIGGKDTAEKIANTRAAIQGLNQSILSARAQLKGQGQVSDYEGKLLAKATAGDIADLTVAEIKQLAELNKKLSTRVISQHVQLTTKLKSHTPTAPIADLFELNPGNTGGVVDFGSLK